jgi:outer membrane biosynthesis protein TonB
MADPAAEKMMNRLQKKCVIASAGFHLLLVIILFVGPAFLSSPEKLNHVDEITIIPDRLMPDGAASNPGALHAAAPIPTPPKPPAPVVQAPTPPALEKTRDPDPPKEVIKEVKPVKPQTESLEPVKDRKPKLPADSLKVVTRKDSRKTAKQSPAADTQAQQLADARRRLGDMVSKSANRLGDGLSSATPVDVGTGSDGPSSASYASWVRFVYFNAWVPPEDSNSDSAVAEATVTILRDGSVISSQFTNKSGDAQVDASIQRTLDRITSMKRPFPEGMKDKQRTYILHFDLKAKRGLA